jgi:UDP-N-acetylglucosamine 4,6-dehydratase/5-epimerase
MSLNGKSILITGGTGSFGKKFVEHILENYTPKRLVIYSRDELKQYEMAQIFPADNIRNVRYFIGDIRDENRFRRACEGIDIIVHAAALKQVPAAEYNPFECIKTNILGAQNVIEAALDMGVSNVVALSTDKAAAPINLYGATKLCSDKLFVAANNIKGTRNLKFSVVRYGNVIGSRGSVMPFFLEQRKKGVIPITDPNMTRFNISLEEGVKMVIHAIESSWGGEVFVPKIPSYRIMDVAQAIAPDCEYKIVGIRPGEKLHEEMITETDSFNTIELKDYYVICPSTPLWTKEEYCKEFGGKDVEPNFTYNSGTNDEWLSVEQIREQVKEHIDPNFSI